MYRIWREASSLMWQETAWEKKLIKISKKLDVGDVIGIRGEVFRTKTGEISIHAAEVTLLSKSLQILPEKFHGLTNTDLRYRQRYVDLIMNPEVKDTFIKTFQKS